MTTTNPNDRRQLAWKRQKEEEPENNNKNTNEMEEEESKHRFISF